MAVQFIEVAQAEAVRQRDGALQRPDTLKDGVGA